MTGTISSTTRTSHVADELLLWSSTATDVITLVPPGHVTGKLPLMVPSPLLVSRMTALLWSTADTVTMRLFVQHWSKAVGISNVNGAAQVPGAFVSTNGAISHWPMIGSATSRTGGTVSSTVTVNEQEFELPAGSVAVRVTV